jgi:hypothetical protein
LLASALTDANLEKIDFFAAKSLEMILVNVEVMEPLMNDPSGMIEEESVEETVGHAAHSCSRTLDTGSTLGADA